MASPNLDSFVSIDIEQSTICLFRDLLIPRLKSSPVYIEPKELFNENELLILSETIDLNFSYSLTVVFHLSSDLTSSSLSCFISPRYSSSFCSFFYTSFFNLLISLTALTFSSFIIVVIFSVLDLSAWRVLKSLSRSLYEV